MFPIELLGFVGAFLRQYNYDMYSKSLNDMPCSYTLGSTWIDALWLGIPEEMEIKTEKKESCYNVELHNIVVLPYTLL